MKIILAGIVAMLTLASCGSTTITPAAIPITHCVIYAYGHDARVFVLGPGADGLCGKMIKTYAASGILFDYTPTVPQEGGFGTVCTMTSHATVVTVADDGGQDIGQAVCTALASAGWAESQPATPSSQALPPGVTRANSSGSYFVNCTAAQCTSSPGAGPFGTTCGPISTGMQLCSP